MPSASQSRAELGNSSSASRRRMMAAAAYRDYAARAVGGPAQGAPARAELGAALAAGGLLEEAAAELAASSALDPSNVDTVVALARAHLNRKDIQAAGRALEAAVARGLEDARLYAALA
ncbi:MAG TPA: hypothetical protein VG148_19015, partial [Pyrinomonadaceae bacterium]|nr:hypothetical protein [Pyrinomonadaceae bacterium]